MKHSARPFWINIVLLVLALLASVMVGSVFIPPQDIFQILLNGITGRPPVTDQLQTYTTILLSLRLPRTIMMLLVGASLAGSGSAFQGLFRNPLADPYLIGVASGAGLGAVLAMTVKWPYTTLGLMAVPLAAFAGAVVTVLLVYELARVGRTVPTTNLILAGVAISAFATALTSFLMINSTGELRRALVWLMGGSTFSGWQPVLAVLPYVALGLGVLILSGYSLNVLQFGDDQAKQLGLNVERVRLIVVAAATLVTAAAVSYAGIIGFIGLIAPHVARLLWGSDYRRILPLSIFCGATLLLISDVLARVLMQPQELPVGIITALAGAPFFLWVLRRAKQQNFW